MRSVITFLLIGAALWLGWDFYQRRALRAQAGPGYELRHGQLLKVRLTRALRVEELKPGDELRFEAQPASAAGSTAIGDGILTGTVAVARVSQCGWSKTLGHQAALFEFRELRWPSRRRALFKASVHSEDDPAYQRDAPIIGSFVGMEYGPLGIIGGFVLDALAPQYYGRYAEAPQCYVVGDLESGHQLWLKVHTAAYIPFDIR